MDIAGATHLGLIRLNNEDSYIINEHDGKYLLIVADGMGGHHAGEVASLMAVDAIKERFDAGFNNVEEFLSSAIQYTNELIYKAADEDLDKIGMGTTIDAVIIDNSRVSIAHIGDSRVYKLSEKQLNQVTEDHSYVQELVNQGVLTSKEAQTHPQKNLITRVLGSDEDTKPDIISLTWEPGDILLICSDGLTNHISDSEISNILRRKGKLQTKVDAFIKLANVRGGKDNITVIIAKY